MRCPRNYRDACPSRQRGAQRDRWPGAGVHSIAELEAYIRAQDKKLPPERLIFVPKVYSTRLTDHRYPTRYELDEAAPNREVVADNGYAAVLNSALLKKLGI